jgi:phenylalanyl-tRNA synthetase alpha chain
MIDEIKAYAAATTGELEAFRLKYIGRKSVINDLFGRMKDVAPEERKEMGRILNELKNTAQE